MLLKVVAIMASIAATTLGSGNNTSIVDTNLQLVTVR